MTIEILQSPWDHLFYFFITDRSQHYDGNICCLQSKHSLAQGWGCPTAELKNTWEIRGCLTLNRIHTTFSKPSPPNNTAQIVWVRRTISYMTDSESPTDNSVKHRKTQHDKYFSSSGNGLLLSCRALCLLQRNNPIYKRLITADPEALHALSQNSSLNNWHFAITQRNYMPITIPNLLDESKINNHCRYPH